MAMFFNSVVVNFPNDVGTAEEFSCWTEQDGGTYKGGQSIVDVDGNPVTVGTPLRFPVGALEVEQPRGDYSNAGAEESAQTYRDNTDWVQIHSGPRGADGTQNQIGTRTQATWSPVTS